MIWITMFGKTRAASSSYTSDFEFDVCLSASPPRIGVAVAAMSRPIGPCSIFVFSRIY